MLARSFPGLQVLLKASPEAGREDLHARGLLVLRAGDAWAIEVGRAVKTDASSAFSGHGDPSLITAVQDLEAIN